MLAIRAEDQALRLIGEGLALDREIDLAQLIELDALFFSAKFRARMSSMLGRMTVRMIERSSPSG